MVFEYLLKTTLELDRPIHIQMNLQVVELFQFTIQPPKRFLFVLNNLFAAEARGRRRRRRKRRLKLVLPLLIIVKMIAILLSIGGIKLLLVGGGLFMFQYFRNCALNNTRDTSQDTSQCRPRMETMRSSMVDSEPGK